MKALILFSALGFFSALGPALASAQDTTTKDPAAHAGKSRKPRKGAAAEIGSGVGTAAAGVAKGAGSAATGVAKGVGDLATLHPIDAGAAVGTGAVKAGKNVAVGSAKGVGRIGKGMGHALRKIL